MKKTVSSLLCTFLLFSVLSLPAHAVSKNADVTIKMSSAAPETDGVVESGEYGAKIHSVDYSNNEFISQYDADKSTNADFYMVWDDEKLYLSWVVHTDGHWPVSYNVDYNNDGQTGTATDFTYMWQYSCVQFMICNGAPDSTEKVYQTSQWSGNYFEAGLSIMSDGASYKCIYSKPVGGENTTVSDWSFCGIRNDSANTTTYEVSIPFEALGMDNIEDGTQLGLTYSIGDQEDFNILPSMCEWQDALLGGKNMDNGAVVTLSTQTTDGSIMGKALANPDYTISVTAPASYTSGQTIDVSVILNDIPDAVSYSMVEFFLYYDNSKVEPVLKNDGDVNDNMAAFLKESPGSTGSWESMCKLDETNSLYEISFLTTNAASLISENGSFELVVSFKVKATATGNIVFQVPHAKTLCVDFEMVKHYGNGEKAILTPGNPNSIHPKSGSGLTVDSGKGTLRGVSSGITASGLTSLLENSSVIRNNKGVVAGSNEVIGTGYTITCGAQTATIIVLGDGNGDGLVNAKDFLLAKRAFLGTYTLEGAALSALCIGGGNKPTTMDYLKIKRHFLGTYTLFS